jgi:hypothetical protein
MVKPRAILEAVLGYVRKNPDEVVRAAVNATGLRFGVPLAALRWAVTQLPDNKRMPKDIQIASAAPALRIDATVDAMGTGVRASAAIKIDEISISPNSIRVGVKLSDVKLALTSPSDSPVATLIKSGALDLSRPGDIINVMPKKLPVILEAEGDRIILDLMKLPQLADNPKLHKLLRALTPVLTIGSVETDRDHLYVRLKATPAGLPRALAALREAASDH